MGVAPSEPDSSSSAKSTTKSSSTTPPPPPQQKGDDNLKDTVAMVDAQLRDNIKAVSELVSAYGQNNPMRLREVLSRTATGPGKKVDTEVLDLVDQSVELHNRLFQSAGITPPTEKDGPISDDRLRQVIAQFASKDTNEKAAAVLASQVFGTNPQWKKMVENIFDNMARLQAKARFYEYKFNQLNIFLVYFTRHINTVLRRFISTTTAFVELRERMYSTTISGTIKVLDEVSGQTGTSKDVEVARRASAALQDLQKLVNSSQGELNDFLTNYKRSSIDDIVAYIRESEATMAAPAFDPALEPQRPEQPPPQRPPRRDFDAQQPPRPPRRDFDAQQPRPPRRDFDAPRPPPSDNPPRPNADAPKPDTPKPDAPAPDAPAPKPDAPKPDAPKPDTPKPGPELPRAD